MELKPTDYRCRVCLNVTEHTLHLQERISKSVETLSYMDVLMLCCNIKISFDDAKPKKICYVCMENARTSYQFKIRCERSNSILENEIHSSTKDNSVRDIRLDEAYDSSSADDLILESDIKLAADSDDTTKSDINLVEPPIANYAEETFPKLEGEKTSATSSLNVVNLSISKNTPKLLTNRCEIASDNEVLHMSPCDRKTVSCDICDRQFLTRRKMLSHRSNEHQTNNNIICEVCGIQLSKTTNFKYHLYTHTGERPYKCKLCPKACIMPSSLESHMKLVHSDERNVKCDVCEKYFKTKNCLRKHSKRRHARQLNYKCSVCDKAFIDKFGLNKHSVVHTGLRLFKCEICDRGFGRNHHLKTHMRIHTGEKPHMCHLCGKGFIQAHCLRTHQLKHATV